MVYSASILVKKSDSLGGFLHHFGGLYYSITGSKKMLFFKRFFCGLFKNAMIFLKK